MLPEWIILSVYVAAVIAIVLLVVRMFIRIRQSDPRPRNPEPRRNLFSEEHTGQEISPVEMPAVEQPVSHTAHNTARVWSRSRSKEAAIDVPVTRSDDLAFGGLTPALAALFPDTESRRAESRKELRAAGYYSPNAWVNFAAIRYVAMMMPLLACGVMLLLVPPAFELPMLALLVVSTGIGWAVPRVVLRNKATTRVHRIEQSLPDMIDMLNMCVSQGLTVPDSLRRISHELRDAAPELTQELRIVSEQADIGTLERALENFADRIDSEEVRSFTSLLIQTERMGTSITQALIEYSDNFRESHRQEADRKANNAAFKLLFPTVLCLMPAVYLFLLGPAVIELSNFLDGDGRKILERGQQAVEDINETRRTQVRPQQ